MQSEKSKKAGKAPSSSLLIDFFRTSYQGSLDVLLLEEDMNFNSRATSLLVSAVGIDICILYLSLRINNALCLNNQIGMVGSTVYLII